MSNEPPSVSMEQVEAHLRKRLGGNVRELRVFLHGGAVTLRGEASSYYAKQVAQHVIMKEMKLRVQANEIQVAYGQIKSSKPREERCDEPHHPKNGRARRS
jgi:hypothetical protein